VPIIHTTGLSAPNAAKQRFVSTQVQPAREDDERKIHQYETGNRQRRERLVRQQAQQRRRGRKCSHRRRFVDDRSAWSEPARPAASPTQRHRCQLSRFWPVPTAPMYSATRM